MLAQVVLADPSPGRTHRSAPMPTTITTVEKDITVTFSSAMKAMKAMKAMMAMKTKKAIESNNKNKVKGKDFLQW